MDIVKNGPGTGQFVLKNVLSIATILLLLVTIKRGIVAYYGSSEKAFGSPNFVENAWKIVYEDYAGKDDWYTMVVLGNVWAMAIYWSIGGAYSILDLWAPKFLQKFRIQEDKNTPVETRKFLKAVARVLFNQTVVTFLMVSSIFPIMKWRGMQFSVETIPTFETFIANLAGFILVEEIGFFYTHYLVHLSPFLYKHVHKIHHEWTAPIAITARYAHPVEDILSNMGPILAGPIIMKSHQVVLWVWILIALAATLTAHSGWHFPGLSSPETHDAHHKYFNVFFGPVGILDWLHGTSLKMVGSVEAKRHKVYFSTKSIRELIPDEPKKKS